MTAANEKLEKEVEKLIKENLELNRKLQEQIANEELTTANEKLKEEIENCKKDKSELAKKLQEMEKDVQFEKR